MKSGFYRMHILAALAVGVFLSGFSGPATAASPEEKRAEIRKMRSETLKKLYKVHPRAKGEINKAAGYAVFSNVGINLIFLSAAGGSGVAHDNRTGKDVYMKMISGGVGFGLGVKDFRASSYSRAPNPSGSLSRADGRLMHRQMPLPNRAKKEELSRVQLPWLPAWTCIRSPKQDSRCKPRFRAPNITRTTN